MQEVWNGEEHERIIEQATRIVDVFTEGVHTQGEELPERELVEDAAELIFKLSDPVHGGIKGAPKFPIGYQSNFLLHECATEREGRALFVVERTLDMMQRGGIYDHLGGGFSRYSIDEQWLVPHFEKMLYDNALLTTAIWKRGRLPRNLSTAKFAKRRFAIWCAICAILREVFIRLKMQIQKVTKAFFIRGSSMRSEIFWEGKRAPFSAPIMA